MSIYVPYMCARFYDLKVLYFYTDTLYPRALMSTVQYEVKNAHNVCQAVFHTRGGGISKFVVPVHARM